MGNKKKLKIMLYNLQDYDIPQFQRYRNQYDMKFLTTRLDENTAVFSFDCDAVIATPRDRLDSIVIDELVECGVKLLAMRSAGYDNLDVAYARDKLTIANVPDYSPYSIAEYATALMLTAVRKTHKAYNRTREHNFSISSLTGFELHGKTIGIIGEGNIGQAAISICKGLGMNVIVYTPHPHHIEDVDYVTLEELYGRSDVIQLHCPLTPDTHHMINDTSIAAMKDGVVLVNTARGALVDTQALIRGLISGKIRAAGLDVYEGEGKTFTKDYTEDILEDDVLQILLGFPNVVISAHQAYFTEESLNNITDTTMENIREFFETGDCRNRV